MSWLSGDVYTTVTGLDIVLWLLVYVAWRTLRGSESRASAQDASTDAEGETAYDRPSQVRGRWSRRKQRIDRLQHSIAHTVDRRRRTSHAA